jgi:two-component system, sensor histidine kinase and response regulator
MGPAPLPRTASASADVLDPNWIVRLLRISYLVGAAAQLADIAQYIHSPAARVQMPLDLLDVSAALLLLGLSLRRGFIDRWKPLTFAFTLLLVTTWTCNSVIVGHQVELFASMIVLLMATCALVPWEPRWQLLLTAFCLLAAAANSALIRPASPLLAELWIDLTAATLIGLASNRLWARWRLALITANHSALAASRAKSEFLSSMSHEIRTPMNAILGMADLLAETQVTPEQKRFVTSMISNGNALLNLINGILDLARIESGRLNLEETDFDLEELIEHVAETLSLRANEKGLELTSRILPGVPPRLVGDTLRLRQVLINLVGNAIKFTEQGEVAVTVGSSPLPDGAVELRFCVRDTGIGIAPDQLDPIFHSFTQADSSTTRRYGGSGLGLTIASRLVELMGGRISVSSAAGAGSTFEFVARLPIADGPGVAAEKLPYLRGVRVLVVDDNATNRLILRELVSAQGAEVDEASTGIEALAEAERARTEDRPYRLVLLDYRMPEMDGFQVARQLKRQAGAAQPVILMLSSEDLNRTLATLREIGIDLYVVKPVRHAELLRAIALAMGRAAVEVKAVAPSSNGITADAVRPLKILLAEDSPDNRLLIEAYLRNLPYEVDTADNGQVAVAKFVKGKYDVVLMDVQMPVMDGYTAVRRIRAWERERGCAPTPIAALTASALEEDVRNSVAAGCTAHLSKPIKKSRLLAALRDLSAAPHEAPIDKESAAKIVETDPE